MTIIAAAGPAGARNGGKYYPRISGTGIITSYWLVAAGILSAGVFSQPDLTSRMILYGIAGLISIIILTVLAGLVSFPVKEIHYTSTLLSRFRIMPGIFFPWFHLCHPFCTMWYRAVTYSDQNYPN